MAEFFGEKQPAAVLKHAILERYLPVFINKTGSSSWKNRVAYVDGFAGPGLYADGSAGSPAVAVETARILSGFNVSRQVDGHLVEANPDSCAALRDYLKDQDGHWTVYEGDVHEHLERILDALHESEAAFFFLDPFGLGLPFDMLERAMSRAGDLKYGYRTKGAATELLINFSLPGLWRNAGHLVSDKRGGSYERARLTIVDKVDRSMGGPWWREIWKEEPKGVRDEKILDRYINQLGEMCRGIVTSIPCADRWQGPRSYYLIHVTQHPDGVWLFNQSVSTAMEIYREHCLRGADRDLFDDIEVREDAWVAAIKRNIERELATGPFVVVERMDNVYGDTIGTARETHVRTALKQLCKEGKATTSGKGNAVGDIASMRVKPA